MVTVGNNKNKECNIMKKWYIYVAIVMAAFVLVGCSKDEATTTESSTGNTTAPATISPAETATLQDGVYFAMEDAFDNYSGWKHAVTVVVEGGKIASIDWDGAHKDGGESKKTKSLAGTYGMNGAEGTWVEQADRAVEYLMANYETKGTATPDAVSGVSMTIDPLFVLTTQALAQGPVGYGPYVDGFYYAEEAEYSKSWKYNGSFTVIGGYIVSAKLDAVHENGGDTKRAQSIAGTYGMNGAEGTWVEQAVRIENALIENQGVGSISFEGGKTDDIAGVSMTAVTLFNLAEQAITLR